jgi:cytochrome c-type biogenesis protein CcmE
MIYARKQKIKKIVFILSVISIVVALVLYALRQNISLFYTPTQVTSGEAPLQHPIRIGGMVEKNSLVRTKGLEVKFKVTDFNKTIEVIYVGILPDLFREGQGIVAEGVVNDNQHFIAKQVLAKHDEKYMPPEVRDSLVTKAAT